MKHGSKHGEQKTTLVNNAANLFIELLAHRFLKRNIPPT